MTDPNTPAGATPPPSYPPAAPQPYESAPPAAYGAPAQPTVPGKTLGIVALVLAIVPIGLQLVGLILGIVALVQSKKAGQKNGFALAAIIVSAVLLVVGVIIAIILFAVFATAGGDLANQIQACIDNGGTGTVEFQGVTMTCEELLEQSNR
ncbi:MAG: DUF4190 domain-containing protein [Microbacterium sp.]